MGDTLSCHGIELLGSINAVMAYSKGGFNGAGQDFTKLDTGLIKAIQIP